MKTELAEQVLSEELKQLDKRIRNLDGQQRRFQGPLEEKLKLLAQYRALRTLRSLRRAEYFNDVAKLEAK